VKKEIKKLAALFVLCSLALAGAAALSAADNCALAYATTGEILAPMTADIDCDGVLEVGELSARSLSVSTDEVQSGIYTATWMSVVDTDLRAGNIRSDYAIFGKTGTFTTGATAVAADMLSGKTAGVNGNIIVGTMQTRTLNPANDTVSAGYYAATTLSQVDTDLAAANIKIGVNIFGKVGTSTNFGMPDTGQTVSYAVSFDDDADFNPASRQMSYSSTVISGNAVTIDNVTGLMWAQVANREGCRNGTNVAWETAGKYCEDLTFASYTDWRLPNVYEFFSLANFIKVNYNSAIDPVFFPNATWYAASKWTSTTYASDTDRAWRWEPLDHSSLTAEDKVTVTRGVRCVRGP